MSEERKWNYEPVCPWSREDTWATLGGAALLASVVFVMFILFGVIRL